MELLRNVAEAQRMSALGSMAGAVAHHFNNLLGGIMTTIDFAQEADDAEMNRRALRTTATVLARAKMLAHSLLAFAEGDHSDSPSEDMTETVGRFIESNRAKWAELDIEVEADLEAVGVSAPAKRVLTVLDVLTTNAREAMLDGGTMRVGLSRVGHDRVSLQVSDTGVGVPAEQVRHVFDPFFTTKRSQESGHPTHPGLGLAVVHGIVKDLGGTVTLDPREGGGSVLTVNLPVDMNGH
jgi:signal transduction histidine kinase